MLVFLMIMFSVVFFVRYMAARELEALGKTPDEVAALLSASAEDD